MVRIKNFDIQFVFNGFRIVLTVTALNRGISIYLTNLLGMFDVLTEQEIAKVKPYIY